MSEKHWNLVGLVTKYGGAVTRDFEGFASADEVLALCKPDKNYWWDILGDEEGETFRNALRDIGVNILYEMVDQTDTGAITPDMVEGVFYAVYTMLTCQSWLKSGLTAGNTLPAKPAETELLPNQLEAVRLLGTYTGGSYRIWALAGNAKRSCRKHVAETLHGRKPTPTETGIFSLQKEFYALSRVQGNCLAAQEQNFIKWAKALNS